MMWPLRSNAVHTVRLLESARQEHTMWRLLLLFVETHSIRLFFCGVTEGCQNCMWVRFHFMGLKYVRVCLLAQASRISVWYIVGKMRCSRSRKKCPYRDPEPRLLNSGSRPDAQTQTEENFDPVS